MNELLDERAIEIDANGKPYAVQDTLITQKTKDATGNRDTTIRNGTKDPNLTPTEKEVFLKSVQTLKQLGKIKDISKEFNVFHGPDLLYIPIEDKVKVTPDNGSQPYKIKIPESVVSLLNKVIKPYDYDLLTDGVCAILNKDLVNECKEVLESKFRIVETITGKDARKYGYLENEATLFKIKESVETFETFMDAVMSRGSIDNDLSYIAEEACNMYYPLYLEDGDMGHAIDMALDYFNENI